LFYLLFRLGGWDLLAGFAAATAVGSLLLTWSLMKGPTDERILFLCLAFVGSTPGWALRPLLFSLLFLPLSAWLVLRRRWIWLPPLFGVWANLHGGVALGVAFLGGATLAACLHDRPRVPRLATVTVLSAAFTLATPLGLRLWPSIVQSIALSRADGIQEWRPASLFTPADWPLWIGAVLLIGFAVRHWGRATKTDDRILVWTALLFVPLAVRHARNIGPFLLLAAPALTRLRSFDAPQPEARNAAHGRGAALGHRVIAVVAVLGCATAVGLTWHASPPFLGRRPVSTHAAAAMRSCPAPVYNEYADGGYVMWFAPNQKVFLDSRQDPYPPEFLRRQRDVELSGDYGPAFARYGIKCAILRPGSRTSVRLHQDGWRTWYRDDEWIMFVAED
jgi:hypothetical protein